MNDDGVIYIDVESVTAGSIDYCTAHAELITSLVASSPCCLLFTHKKLSTQFLITQTSELCRVTQSQQQQQRAVLIQIDNVQYLPIILLNNIWNKLASKQAT